MKQKAILKYPVKDDDYSDTEIINKLKIDIKPIIKKFAIPIKLFGEEFMTNRRGVSKNKRDIAINLYGLDGKRRSYQENYRTTLHELGHVITPQIGHTELFKQNFYKLVDYATNNCKTYKGARLWKSDIDTRFLLSKTKKVIKPGSKGAIQWWVDEKGLTHYGLKPVQEQSALTDIELYASIPLAKMTSKEVDALYQVILGKDAWKFILELRANQKRSKYRMATYLEYLRWGNDKERKDWNYYQELHKKIKDVANSNPDLKRYILAQIEEKRNRKLLKKQEKAKKLEERLNIGKSTEGVNKLFIDLLKEDYSQERVNQIIAYLSHIGFFRVVNRGVRKGALAVDKKVAKELKYYNTEEDLQFARLWAEVLTKYNNKFIDEDNLYSLIKDDKPTTLFIPTVGNDLLAMIAEKLGLKEEMREEAYRKLKQENRQYKDETDEQYNERLNKLKEESLSWKYDLNKHGYNTEFEKKGINEKINKYTYEIYKKIKNHNEGNDTSLTAILEGGEEIKEIIAGRESMEDIVSESKKLREDALGAQENGTLILPKRLNKEALKAGDLWDRQKKAVNWMMAVKKGILAFDTGLGKTISALTAGLILRQKKKTKFTIIFTPAEVQPQWREEIKKFTTAKVLRLRGGKKKRIKIWKKIMKKPPRFILAKYGQLQSDLDMKYIKRLKGGMAIFDEGTVLKTRGAKTTKGAQEVLKRNEYGFVLSATPIPNYPTDLYNMLNMFHKGAIGSKKLFEKEFVMKRIAEGGMEIETGYQNLDKLHQLIKPYVFIKRKTDPDIEMTLPPITTLKKEYMMPAEQYDYYANAAQDALRTAINLEEKRSRGESLGIADRAHIFAKIMTMRQMAVTPAIKFPNYKGAAPKIDNTIELIKAHIQNDPNHGVIVSSEFVEPLLVLKKRLLEEGYNNGEIAEIHSKAKRADRKTARQRLNAGTAKVGLLGRKAAGEGLNLQGKATKLIFIDKPWTSKAVEQMIGRIWREGQKQKVTVIHQAMNKSIDDMLEKKIEKKKLMSEGILTGAKAFEQVTGKVSAGDWVDLLLGIKDEIKEIRLRKSKEYGKEYEMDKVLLL